MAVGTRSIFVDRRKPFARWGEYPAGQRNGFGHYVYRDSQQYRRHSHQERDRHGRRRGGGPIACAGYLNTNVFTATWPSTQNGSVPMGPLDAGVVKFTTGSATGNGQLLLSTAGNNAGTTHDYTLSTQPCDFGPGLKRLVGAGAPTFRMTVSNTPGNYPNLLPNTTYYVNVRNNDTTGCVANGSTCDLYPVNLTGP